MKLTKRSFVVDKRLVELSSESDRWLATEALSIKLLFSPGAAPFFPTWSSDQVSCEPRVTEDLSSFCVSLFCGSSLRSTDCTVFGLGVRDRSCVISMDVLRSCTRCFSAFDSFFEAFFWLGGRQFGRPGSTQVTFRIVC